MARKWQIAIVGVVAMAAVGVYFGRDQVALARIGTAFAAKVTCSCLFVSGRSPGSCMTDYNPADARWFTWHIGDRRVTVSALGVFSATATFDEGYGCHVTQ